MINPLTTRISEENKSNVVMPITTRQSNEINDQEEYKNVLNIMLTMPEQRITTDRSSTKKDSKPVSRTTTVAEFSLQNSASQFKQPGMLH